MSGSQRSLIALSVLKETGHTVTEKGAITVDVAVSPKQDVFYVIISMEELKWQSEFGYSELKNFHKTVGKIYPSIEREKLPDKKDIIKDKTLLSQYLEKMFSFQTIRENIDVLKLIGLKSLLTNNLNDYVNTYQQQLRTPLLDLDMGTRECIADLITFLSLTWNSHELTRYFLRSEEVYCQTNSITRDSRSQVKYSEKVLLGYLQKLEIPEDRINSIINKETQLLRLDEKYRWAIVWELLLQALSTGTLDSRVHVSVQICASLLGLSLVELSVAEQECAAVLQKQLIEMKKMEEKNESKNRVMKIVGGAAIGGGLMFIAGLIALPLLLPIMVASFGVGAAAVAALPVAGAAAISAGIAAAGALAVSAASVIPFLFGALGAGLIGYKISNVTEGISEFQFVRVPLKVDDDGSPCPQERFIVDWENKRITDTYTGEVHLVQNSEIDFKSLVKMLEKAAMASEHGNNPEETKKDKKQQKKTKEKSKDKIDREREKLEAEEEQKKQEQLKQKEEEEIIQTAGMEVMICVNGWLWSDCDVTRQFSKIRKYHPGVELYSLQWQTDQLLRLGQFIVCFVTDQAIGYILQAIICALSATAAAVFAALTIPLYIVAASILVDNPWTVVANHAKRAGKLLAKAIIAKPAGNRPITLLGWSHGARVIFSALEYLNKLNNLDYRGIIQNVYLIGGSVTSRPSRWEAVRPLVAGRMVNAYSKSDWLLPTIHRITTGKAKTVAGITRIELPTIENVDITDIVGGHLNYSTHLNEVYKALHLSSSVSVAYAHRSHGDTFYPRIPDTCLRSLCDKMKVREHTEKEKRKVKRREQEKLLAEKKQQIKLHKNPGDKYVPASNPNINRVQANKTWRTNSAGSLPSKGNSAPTLGGKANTPPVVIKPTQSPTNTRNILNREQTALKPAPKPVTNKWKSHSVDTAPQSPARQKPSTPVQPALTPKPQHNPSPLRKPINATPKTKGTVMSRIQALETPVSSPATPTLNSPRKLSSTQTPNPHGKSNSNQISSPVPQSPRFNKN